MKTLYRIIAVIMAAAIFSPIYAQTLGKSNRPSHKSASGMSRLAGRTGKAMRLATKARPSGTGIFSNGKTAGFRGFASPFRSPDKIGAMIPTIYGSIIHNDQIAEGIEMAGLYEIPKNSSAKGAEIFSGPDATFGGVMADGKYWCNTMLDLEDFYYVFIYGYDMETGVNTDFIMGTDENLARAMTYDATTGNIYGIFFTEGLQSLQLATIVYDSENAIAVTSPIAELAGNWNSLACDSQGQLYGISYTADLSGGLMVVTGAALNKIDKTTGEVTKIGDMGDYAPQYASGCVIDPATDRMYWNYNPIDGSAYMCEVDLSTGETSTLYRLSHNDEIVGMYIPAAVAEAKAPGEATGLDADFSGGSLEGTFSFNAPKLFFDGSEAVGSMKVSVTLNGDEIYSEEAVDAGSKISVPVLVPEPGLYSFGVTASNDSGIGPEASLRNIWIGSDSPVAPKVTLTHQGGTLNVSWTASSSSVNGGYLDYNEVSYTVTRFPGAIQVATGLKTTSFTETVEIPSDHMETFYYEVVADFNGLSSAVGQSNPISLGTIIPPYLNEFSDEKSLDGWTIEDANGDNETWVYDLAEQGVTISFGPSASDDWLISPPVRLEKGKAYHISFDVRGRSTTWHQLVELKYGMAAEGKAMTGTLSDPVKLTDQKFVSVGDILIPEEDGVYYIGLHDISEADQLAVLCDNFRIQEGVSVLAPGEATGINISPDINGGLSAEINFTSPDKDIVGNALKSLDKVELFRGDVLLATFDAPGIGKSLSFYDTVEEKGLYTYRVTGHNAYGCGLTAEARNYIGGAEPEAPSSVTLIGTPGEGSVTVTWNAVTKDIYGNPVDPTNVRYVVYNTLSPTPDPIVSGHEGTTYSFTVADAGSQSFAQCAVAACNAAGEGEATVSDMIAVGTPYAGFHENFADGETHYNFGVMSEGEATWRMCTDATFADGIKSRNGDNGFLACRSGGPGVAADLITGLVSLKGIDNPGVSFYTYNIVDGEDDDNNELRVYVKGEEENEYNLLLDGEINDLCEGRPGWKRISLPLNGYEGQTIQVKFTAIQVLFMYTMLDDISISTIPDYDMAIIGFSADDLVMAGSKFNAKACVANYGALPAGQFNVSLYTAGMSEPVETVTVEALKPGTVLDVDFETVLSPFATDAVEYYAEVDFSGDSDFGNNRSESQSVAVMRSYVPEVTDLAGDYTEAGVRLTWSEPDIDSCIPTVTHNFEDGKSFADSYGTWTFVDCDGTPIGGFQGIDLPGITGGSTTGSFWVWDTNIAGTGNVTFEAHSGSRYLFSLYRVDDGEADDWAISPELQGCAQTVSFYARSYSNSEALAEKIEVYYSTSSVNPSDFIRIEGAGAEHVPAEWTLFSADLPEGARYFAIRSCAVGAFMLMVDDVTFSPAGATLDASLLGFDIYRNGIKINDAAVEDFEFTDINVVYGERYVYNVVALYDVGMSRPSEDVTIAVSGVETIADDITIRSIPGGIEVFNAAGKQLTVTDMRGVVIFSGNISGRTFVKADQGVYAVKAGTAFRKVYVR